MTSHMLAGGIISRTASKGDRFFYKIKDGKLLCRVNEMGGWNPAIADPKWETDDLRIEGSIERKINV